MYTERMDWIKWAGACALLLALGAVGGCSADNSVTTADLIEQIRQLDAGGALALANDWRTTRPDVSTTLTADEVTFLFPDGEEVAAPLPNDRMVLAVAPYLTTTHPCEIHSISGCPGELAGVSMWVLAEAVDGSVRLNEVMTAMDNGFVELWLPRDGEYDLTIEAEGKTAVARVTTYATSKTCIPELKLE